MGLKILHSADWHLDSPFAGFPEDQRQLLKAELRKVPEKIADLCRREGCELVLLPGDLFDGPYSRESAARLKHALEDMAVPVFISPGNHDFVAPGSPWLEERWPGNVHIFTGGLESVALPMLDCRIYGAGYTAMDCPGLLENFRAEGAERYCVAVLHGDAVRRNSPYCPVTPAQLRDSGLDYLAMGHIHSAGTLRAGSTLCAWPGCPMGRGWDETGEKGAYIAELGGDAEVRFVPLDTPRFYDWEAEWADLDALLPAGESRDFYRITLTGSGGEDVEFLRQHFPNLTLRDHRKAETDLWEPAGEDSLEGIYFRLLREKLAGPEPECVRLAAEISRKLLSGGEVVL